MRFSVVITTYNQPAWLELVLHGYAAQTARNFEVIVADDGSDDRTVRVLERIGDLLGRPLLHVWHEDRGFRKCEILNRAILAASGDALLFTDGDCIPRPDFVQVHTDLMRPGRFLSGGYIKIPEEPSRAIDAESVLNGNATSFSWLRSKGAPLTRPLLRMRARPAAARLLDAVTPTGATFNGHNASVWRDDAIRVNGFDNRMGWGGLDREFGERLENAGVKGLQIRHRAHVVHLHHGRGYRREEIVRANRTIRDETAALGRVETPFGIRQLEGDGLVTRR